MLQVTDTGATITLTGKAAKGGTGLFWLGFAVLIGALGVAMAMSLLPTRLAIGALALLIVGSFVVNKVQANQKKSTHTLINSGILRVQQGRFVHIAAGHTHEVVVAPQDTITVEDTKVDNTRLLICDANGNIRQQVVGFESAKEAQVMQAVLQGQQFGKRNANIKMQAK